MADAGQATGKLNVKQVAFVEAYLGEARGHVTKAAVIAGYSERTAYSIGSELLKKPEIQEAVQEWRDKVRARGVALIEYRLYRLDEMDKRYWRIVEARAIEHANDPRASGGETGFVVKQHKIIGGGENAQFVTEYVADTALTKEIRAVYDDAAKELGQRVEKSEAKLDATDAFMAALRAYGGHSNA